MATVVPDDRTEANAPPILIGIIGDYDAARPTHAATDAALVHAASALGVQIRAEWLATRSLDEAPLQRFAALFVAPGSPYENVDAALRAIRFAREQSVPLLGTCGGFQHVVLEFARNALDLASAHHAEYEPNATELVIAPLACSLSGQRATVHLAPGTRASSLYAAGAATEAYRCSFGLAARYVPQLERAGLVVSGVDDAGEARIVELRGHPFYVATLFVPQLSSQPHHAHPLVRAFVAAAMRRAAAADTEARADPNRRP